MSENVEISSEQAELERQWARFGRWMAVCSGVVFLTLAIYQGDALISLLLRIWSAFVGVYFLYTALRR